MINLIAQNSNRIGLDQELKCFRNVDATIGRVTFLYFLKHLHLPVVAWDYNVENNKELILQEPEIGVQLNQIFFNSEGVQGLVFPAQLYTYYLLTSYFGIHNPLSSIFLMPGTNNRLLFDTVCIKRPFNSDKLDRDNPERNNLKLLLKGIRNKKLLLEAHEAFFVIIDEKFADRINTVCLEFTGKTGIVVNRKDWVEDAINLDRLKRLEAFSLKLINEL